jgi:CDP-glycerol glycerophosphotransferase
MESDEPPPLLSVVVPVYRVERYLADCLDSILAEAGNQVEVIAVDDGSPDRSGEIADEYARRDPRVRLVRLPGNVGLGQARNAGVDRAAGDYVWFVDSDDWLPAGAMPAVLDRLGSTRPDVLIVDHAEVYEDGASRPVRSGRPLAGLIGPIRLAECPRLLRLAQSACTKIVRRAFLDESELRFLPGWYEDSSFSHPLLMAAGHIEVLDRVCYCYRQRRAGGITRTVSPRHFEVFEQYQRLFEIVDKAAPGYDQFRPELFRLMIDHYLVIVGNQRRVPPGLRKVFFRRMAKDFRFRLPEGGYPVPAGVAGLKHRLVRRDAYLAYATLRLAHRAMSRLLRRPGGAPARRPASGPPLAPVPPPSAGQTPGR